MVNAFEGKVAVVTGAGSGIGRACALAFAAQGAKVVVADIDTTGGEQTVRLITAARGDAEFVLCDVSTSAGVRGLMTMVTHMYGALDLACNNAGVGGPSMTSADYPEEEWRRVIDVNLTGVWLCMKHEIPIMLTQGKGAIVNMASALGTVGFATAPAYVAAKHGLIGLTKTAALEYATQNIRINAVCPGFVHTPMLQRVGSAAGTDWLTAFSNLHPMKRLCTADEVAAAVMWLCSDAAAFVTGHALMVDGGYTAQ